MGLGRSTLVYEGYGRTKEEAVLSLDGLLRFHHEHVNVKYVLNIVTPHYFVWDGTQEHKIHYERSKGYIRAFIFI
jgi:hypothetical protein